MCLFQTRSDQIVGFLYLLTDWYLSKDFTRVFEESMSQGEMLVCLCFSNYVSSQKIPYVLGESC